MLLIDEIRDLTLSTFLREFRKFKASLNLRLIICLISLEINSEIYSRRGREDTGESFDKTYRG